MISGARKLKSSRVQGFKVSRVQGFKGSKFCALKNLSLTFFPPGRLT
jgi:hypothetical protein